MGIRNYLLGTALLSLCLSCQPGENTGNNNLEEATLKEAYAGPPYTIQVEEFVNPALPGLHSYTHGVYQDKIIMIGGRINGLHLSYNFSLTYANKDIYVVDTKNWSDPSGWEVHSMSHSNIRGIDAAQFRANNAQFFQNEGVLYIVGGLEYANVNTSVKRQEGKVELILEKGKTMDGKPAKGPESQPYMTAVDMNKLVEAVMADAPLMPPYVRQVSNDSLRVTGGELEVIGGEVYLVFGWNFNSSFKDDYTHQIRKFSYTDDGTNLSLGPITVCPTCWDGEADTSTTGAFRRRDGSLSPVIDARTGEEALMFYSGVFKDGNTHFVTPVMIHPGRAKELDFEMRWNVYTCQVVPVYSAKNKASYASFLGGMTYTKYNGGPITMPTKLTAANSPAIPTSTANFGFIPQSNAFTTLTMKNGESMAQYLLPDSFPPIAVPLPLPAIGDSIPADTLPTGTITFNGSESELHWSLAKEYLSRDGVVNYDAFIQNNPSGGIIGYLHGGIESAQPNVFGLGGQTLHRSVASKRLFSVKVVPL